jgi:2-polyprenyl-3-methyl-5-hydroxy-6-metoxy-1,4-benzoquinol methylase
MGDQASGVLSNFLREQRLRAASGHLRGRILDVGCGVGALAPLCSAGDYVGVDQDPASIDLARQRHSGYRFEASIPADERFDVIVLLAVIEHVPDPAGFLRPMVDCLAEGGCFVLTTPYRRAAWMHGLGAKVGLCSAEADAEHEIFFDRPIMEEIAASAGLRISEYRRFLFGVNQLFLLERS